MQSDYNLLDQSGAQFRQELNTILESIATMNSGPSAPTDTFPNMFWVDETAGLLKMRNAADSGWITIGSIGVAFLGFLTANGGAMNGVLQLEQSTNIASGTTVDLGSATGNSVTVTHSSGTTAISSFGAATSLQAGTVMDVKFSISGGTLSITHNATSLDIPGSANLTLADKDKIRIRKTSDGSANWEIIGITKADGSPVVAISDGAATLAKLDRTGSLNQILVAQGSGNAPVWRDKFGNSVSIATTSGSAIDVTGIPNWANRIILILDDVSTNGSSPLLVQGGSGSIETTGYNSTGSAIQGGGVGAAGATSGFQLSNTDGGAAWIRRGRVELFRKPGTNSWFAESTTSVSGSVADRNDFSAGRKTFGGVLDRIRLTTLAGTDTFDAGSITVSWE